MFRPIPSTVSAFEGYRVMAFRQGRCNLAERTLRETRILFAPPLGRVGIFLPAQGTMVGEATLRAVWEAEGAPKVSVPGPTDVVLFGRVWPVRFLPFAGCDDLWEEAGALVCACRRKADPQTLAGRVGAYGRRLLQERAEYLLERFAPTLPRRPLRIVVKPLRPRILGQCTREGEIRLNPSLLVWPETVLAETLAHELTHLTHFNHSPAFWRALTALLPDWLPRSLAHYLSH